MKRIAVYLLIAIVLTALTAGCVQELPEPVAIPMLKPTTFETAPPPTTEPTPTGGFHLGSKETHSTTSAVLQLT